ncbi:aminotransferase class I/II-fold pyridoxal phosphate-dependent enzyme [Emticicia sp. C21]|uniref:aminotransferase class I/II-fold pyridoxal phosphate-dependent enzyme n=1 Tax=Emticicia sp. C21 TaxID=2302915 RepID=UPI000E34C491|nr:aminotransferase class I/II-fold pyridoxal phosphate-dependent enzyme [Emticicia sp. C21]RFS17229.1 aminotransferase class I/II-fold pyridoxal phosphate-dependent enzyme [Emticicia sp. C21]
MEEKKIWLSSPHMGGNEFEFVKEAFESNWIAPLGPNVDGFEKDICNFTNVPYTAALSSGTAAIHLALILLKVKAGDEVICSSFTFSATCNPIVYQGATPVFIDSEKETWNMDPNFLEEAIQDRILKGKKPKAIILVHLYGMPAQILEIISIANKYEIPLIEDAAEALGSTFKGQHLGTFGFFGIYSFNGNKIITTSGGGALVSSEKKLIEKARFLATQARDSAPHYQHSEIGYNYRMSNICAGIGRGQMLVLKDRISMRRANYEFYVNQFHNISSIEVLPEPSGDFFSNRWLSCVLFKNYEERERIRLVLAKWNIEARPLWKPMNLQPIFKDMSFYGNYTSENLFNRGLCLPSGSNLSQEDLEKTSSVIIDNLFGNAK